MREQHLSYRYLFLHVACCLGIWSIKRKERPCITNRVLQEKDRIYLISYHFMDGFFLNMFHKKQLGKRIQSHSRLHFMHSFKWYVNFIKLPNKYCMDWHIYGVRHTCILFRKWMDTPIFYSWNYYDYHW